MTNLPQVFKGIALITPGGDIIYGIDPSRQTQWHIHLCDGLQAKLHLASSPHFLVPGYTATVERWLDSQTRQLKTIAEVYPAARRYIPLLQTLFELEPTDVWHLAPWQEEFCSRAAIETYRTHFPQLWQRHNLVDRLDPQPDGRSSEVPTEGYALRLFISSENPRAEQTLNHVHQLLEEALASPYSLKIIDIVKHPEQALSHLVTVTPTLIRISPKPVKRIVGQLDDTQRLLNILSAG